MKHDIKEEIFKPISRFAAKLLINSSSSKQQQKNKNDRKDTQRYTQKANVEYVSVALY